MLIVRAWLGYLACRYYNRPLMYNTLFNHRSFNKNLHEPYDAANRSLYALFQHNPVISSFLAFSNTDFHNGRRVPSVSRNSSDASSQYLKSLGINGRYLNVM